MTEPDNHVLQLLRRVDERTGKMAYDVSDLKIHVTSVEEGLAGVHRRIDRVESRLDRIEHRLDLIDVSH